MRYEHISSPETVIQYVTDTLLSNLDSGQRIAWLLSGGSAISLEVAVAKALQNHGSSLLSITLADERYGPLGHADENYLQLMNAGFALPVSRVLAGALPEETAKAFGRKIEHILSEADFSLGIFGIGADGHTAGIKPHSPAANSTKPAIFYEWDDYERITITPQVIQRLDEAVIYAVGKEKADTLKKLIHEEVAIEEQPAQVLKQVETATLYTDTTL